MTLRGEPPCSYTDRELEVLRAFRQEGTIGGAARALGISRHTANAHLRSIRRKHEVDRTWQAFDILIA